MRQGLVILALLLAWGAAPGASVDKPPGPGAIQISYDGRQFDAGYLEAFATVDLPQPTDVGRICVDLTLGTLVRANGTAWVALGGGSVVMTGDVTGTNTAAVVAKASTAWAQTGTITPTAIASSQNDWNPAGLSTASVVQASGTAFYSITGLQGGSAGRVITISNVGASYGLRLRAESASSTAANRFGFADSITIPPLSAATLLYDGVASRWRCVGRDATTTSDALANYRTEFLGSGAGPAGGAITSGGTNLVVGWQAGPVLTGPTSTTIIGPTAGAASTSPNSCTYIGAGAAPLATAPVSVTAIGVGVCPNLTVAGLNTVVVGQGANSKVAFGYDAIIGDFAAGGQLGNNNALGRSVYVGYSAGYGNGSSTQNPDSNVAIGWQSMYAINGARFCAAVGASSLDQLTSTTTARMTAIGYQAGHSAVTGTDCIFLGYASGDSTANSATNRLVAGGSVSPITDVYIGKGETHATPSATVYHATGGAGTNIAGADLKLAGGIGTGTGLGGTVRIQVAAAGTTGSTANTLADALTVDSTGLVTASTGSVVIATAGKGLQIKSGANCKIGTAVLVGGTVTVSTTAVTANSLILLTPQVAGGTLGSLSIGTVTAGTSFIINSSSGTETSTVGWVIIEKG